VYIPPQLLLRPYQTLGVIVAGCTKEAGKNNLFNF